MLKTIEFEVIFKCSANDQQVRFGAPQTADERWPTQLIKLNRYADDGRSRVILDLAYKNWPTNCEQAKKTLRSAGNRQSHSQRMSIRRRQNRTASRRESTEPKSVADEESTPNAVRQTRWAEIGTALRLVSEEFMASRLCPDDQEQQQRQQQRVDTADGAHQATPTNQVSLFDCVLAMFRLCWFTWFRHIGRAH